MRFNRLVLWGALITSTFVAARGTAGEIAIDHDATVPRLQIKGELGGSYQLLAAPAITGLPWEPVLDLTQIDPIHSWFDTTAAAAALRFYRLVKLGTANTSANAVNFRLLDDSGKSRELYYHSDASVVVLVFTQVGGMDADTLSALKSLRDQFASKGVITWLVASGAQDDREQIAREAATLGGGFPILHDRGQLVARQFQDPANNEAVAIATDDWTIIYRGPISERVAARGGESVQNYLESALTSFLAGKTVAFRKVKPASALLALNPLPATTYAKDIAPLLMDKCVRCHSPGNIGPWSMDNHDAVKNYAPLIKDNVLEGHMPPWHADPQFGVFANDYSLKPEQAAQLIQWIDDGAPLGTGGDPLASTPPPAVIDWPLGKPDLIVKIPPQKVPASGVVDYKYPFFPAPITKDTWLRAATVRPDQRANVHHALVFSIAPADVPKLKAEDLGLNGYFAGYVPGMDPVFYPTGTGKLLMKGSYLVFQMHYTTSGTAVSDQTELGLYFSPSKPDIELKTGAAYNTDFTIPPNEADSEAQAEKTFDKDVLIYELSPHMHFRGSRFQFDAIYPDGKTETLLSVPHYHFHWQTLYRLAEPKRLPAGTKLLCRGAFDNSTSNPYNPNANVSVEFGEQTFNEMFIGYVNYSEIP